MEPEQLLASSRMSEHKHLKIIDALGSGHKPVTANITIDFQSTTTKVSTYFLENELHASRINLSQHPDKFRDEITNIKENDNLPLRMGGISSYAYGLMMIFYLQQKGYLPCLQTAYVDDTKPIIREHKDCNAWFQTDRDVVVSHHSF
ncbi:unnamed protein product [Rodentolepis nana]|uniref:Reverse transcriptase domain-containing protein n=1 Tax=Rodentolepis nana TaxID=102285 RepID=A0A0R3TIH4_RODNA|nr:unnamed protein product [Rodentolepis nana]